jgi:predicted porin
MQSKTKFIKLLMGVAVGAAFIAPAMAQTNVTVEGLVDNYVGSTRMAGDTASTAKQGSGGMSTSYIGFKGTEDLGGGLKAKFALTGFLQTDAGVSGRFPGDTLFSRDASVGLAGGFGGVTLGRAVAPNFLPSILFNPLGDSFTFSPLILHMNVPLFNASGWSSSVAGDTGWSNQILYTTPTFGGATVNLHYQFGEAAGNNGKNNVGANVLYFSGPLSLTAFYQKVEVNNPLNGTAGLSNVKQVGSLIASEQKMWFVGGGYDFGVAKINATYDKTTHDVNLEDKTYSLGASVPVGSGKILAAYAQTKRSGTGLTADLKRQTATVGYDHNLSKRTDLYAMLMNDRITNLSSGTSLGLGIRHRF